MVLAWVAFAAWVGWLGVTSLRYGRFPVVSRAQLLNADLVVVAAVKMEGAAASPVVAVKEVIWPAGATADFGPAGLRLDELPDAALGANRITQAGDYVLVLKSSGPGRYRIAPVGRSPLVDPAHHRPAVYPATAEVVAQVHSAAGPAPRAF
jgi:hypothetical protein